MSTSTADLDTPKPEKSLARPTEGVDTNSSKRSSEVAPGRTEDDDELAMLAKTSWTVVVVVALEVVVLGKGTELPGCTPVMTVVEATTVLARGGKGGKVIRTRPR
jgi:hypothetical protein